jgi:pyridoxamine 5'-phosphate oxidase
MMMKKEINRLRKEYLAGSLDVKEVDQNPMIQFEAWFLQAVTAGLPEPNAMVLSTCGHSGSVSSRVVLLKGIEKGGFLFFTNYESRKGQQLAENPKASLLFFWKELERQVRIEGTVKKYPRKQSVDYFRQRPLESRISALISPQSAVIPDRLFLEAMWQGANLDLAGKAPECPVNWGGYRLKPDLIEFWQGRENRLHDRIQYRKSRGGWITERLAP